MNARRNLINNELTLSKKELNGEDAHVIHSGYQPIGVLLGQSRFFFVDARGDKAPDQDAITHGIFSHGVARCVPIHIAPNNDRVLEINGDLCFGNNGVSVFGNKV